ncbi:MAG: Mammalian cell entry [Solirubrobacterales bacterium]|nr:Mammalian cell entry [Solirubrobacterales bacterium]
MNINTDRLKLELSRSRRPFMQYVFLIGVAAFCLIVVLKNQFYNRFWEEKYTFSAQFTDVKGVTPGVQRVKIAGVTVGVVTEATNKDGHAVLKMQLKKEYGPIYKDAKIRLRPLTPLQDMYINLEDRGHKSAGEVGSGDDMLVAARTVSPVDISRVLNEFPASTRTRMQVLLDQFGRGLSDNGADLKWAVGELSPFLLAAQRTSSVVAQRRTQMARLVTNLNRLTTALAQRDQQLTTLVGAGNATLGALSGADAELDATLREIPPTLDILRGAFTRLRAAEDQLDPALQDLGPVADSLEAGMNALERFSTDATPALVALRPAVTRLAPLARDLKPTSVALNGAFTQLRAQAPAYDRITKQTPRCFDVIGNFFNDSLSVLKFSDAYGTYPRGNDSQDLDTVGGVTPIAATGLTRTSSCTDGASR